MMAGTSGMAFGKQTIRALLAGLLLLTASASFSATVTHTVRSQETLWRIAQQYGTSVQSLQQLNGLRGNHIMVGQKLRVSGAGNTVATANKTWAAKSPNIGSLRLASSSVIVVDTSTGQTLFAKNVDQQRPIASITKLMTAMVVLDASPSMQEMITVSKDDIDHLKNTTSRMPIGTQLSRYEMLRLALMSSENRASSALSRHYPGGQTAFIAAMNNKAAQLGMPNTRFYDPTGLTPRNVSTAGELVKMVQAASQYDLIREFTTTANREVALRPRSRPLHYMNSNVLVRNDDNRWDIKVSKTGYIREAGRCLVMLANLANRQAVMIMLDSDGKLSPVGDANRLRNWIESGRGALQLASR
jgi:D-alanyl-D-alanine endopeptidase (penicillin-binding protein 7)